MDALRANQRAVTWRLHGVLLRTGNLTPEPEPLMGLSALPLTHGPVLGVGREGPNVFEPALVPHPSEPHVLPSRL